MVLHQNPRFWLLPGGIQNCAIKDCANYKYANVRLRLAQHDPCIKKTDAARRLRVVDNIGLLFIGLPAEQFALYLVIRKCFG